LGVGTSVVLLEEVEWLMRSSVRTSKGPGVPIRASDVIAVRVLCASLFKSLLNPLTKQRRNQMFGRTFALLVKRRGLDA